MKNRDWMSTFMVIFVIFELQGLSSGGTQENAGEAVSRIVAILLSLVIIFLPLSRGGKKWTLWASTGLGILAVILFGIGAALDPTMIWNWTSAAFGILIVFFGIKALRESS